MSEPRTEAGRALLNLVREPLIYGVTDRMPSVVTGPTGKVS